MKKLNISLCLGIAYVSFWVGMACGRVGELPKNTGEPFPEWLPIAMAALLIPPFLLGWAARSESKSED